MIELIFSRALRKKRRTLKSAGKNLDQAYEAARVRGIEGEELQYAVRDEWDEYFSAEEAIRRLNLQEPAGKLNAALEANEAETFAGVSIQHDPEFRIIAYFTHGGEQAIGGYIEAQSLAGVLEIRTAEESLESLKRIQSETMSRMDDLKITAESAVKIRENRVELYVLDRIGLEEALRRSRPRLSDRVAVVEVDEHSSEVTDIYAGLELDLSARVSPCTSGFTVEDTDGTEGILTAKHCAPNLSTDTISYNGTDLSIQAGSYGGSRDVLWATVSGFTARNLMYDGTNNRYVYSTESRSEITDNEYICKYGVTSGYDCGYVETTTHDRSTAACTGGCTWSATWVVVERTGVDLADVGDSGGPWFYGNTAYGLMTAEWGDKAVFMSLDYIDVLDVTVLTE